MTMALKIMGYADDTVCLGKDKQDMERILIHFENYEKASNALISKKKSNIVTFGPNEIPEINGIKSLEEGQKIRHLGFFLNKKGFINDLDKIIEKIIKTLSILKKTLPHLDLAVKLWKSYGLSNFIYRAEINNISERQIKEVNRVKNWFLFRKCKVFNPKENYRAKVSDARLALPRKYGGKNLLTIDKIFTISKTKHILRAIQQTEKEKPWAEGVIKKMDRFFDENQNDKHCKHPMLPDKIPAVIDKNRYRWEIQALKDFST
jgi:hypothetical protein